MAYIPEAHKKYNLLQMCAKDGREVFSYPSELEYEITDMLPENEGVVPYGYECYDEFYSELDRYVELYGSSNGELNDLGHMLKRFKEIVRKMNVKENWSVLRYIGETTSNTFGLTHGRYYYWPCSIERPEYEGVIDDEEFTSYLAYAVENPVISEEGMVLDGGKLKPYAGYATWEIAEDPTGMAAKVLSGKTDIMGMKNRGK